MRRGRRDFTRPGEDAGSQARLRARRWDGVVQVDPYAQDKLRVARNKRKYTRQKAASARGGCAMSDESKTVHCPDCGNQDIREKNTAYADLPVIAWDFGDDHPTPTDYGYVSPDWETEGSSSDYVCRVCGWSGGLADLLVRDQPKAEGEAPLPAVAGAPSSQRDQQPMGGEGWVHV